ncbi:hypothetical protein ACVBEF_16545 [Glaciimonas sp. GG7]
MAKTAWDFQADRQAARLKEKEADFEAVIEDGGIADNLHSYRQQTTNGRGQTADNGGSNLEISVL